MTMMTDEELRALCTEQKATHIRCEFCGTFNPYGAVECENCNAPLDYQKEENIRYEDVFDAERYAELIRRRGAEARQTQVQSGARKGCVIAALCIAGVLACIIVSGVTSAAREAAAKEEARQAEEAARQARLETNRLHGIGTSLLDRNYYENADHAVVFEDVGTFTLLSVTADPAQSTEEEDAFVLAYRFDKDARQEPGPISRVRVYVSYVDAWMTRTLGSEWRAQTHFETDNLGDGEVREVTVMLDAGASGVRLDEVWLMKESAQPW